VRPARYLVPTGAGLIHHLINSISISESAVLPSVSRVPPTKPPVAW
jgi:hypothetical protein